MKLNHVSGTGLNASPLSHSYNNLWSRNCYPVSRMSKLRLRQSETALSFSSDCRAPRASATAAGRLPGNRARPAPSPPHFRPCALGLWRTRCLDVMAASRLPPATLTLKQVPTILTGLLGQLYWVWARFSTGPCTHSIEGSRGLLGRTTLRAPQSDWFGRGGRGFAPRRGVGGGGRREVQGGWGYFPGLGLLSSPGARRGPGSWSWARIPTA